LHYVQVSFNDVVYEGYVNNNENKVIKLPVDEEYLCFDKLPFMVYVGELKHFFAIWTFVFSSSISV